MSTLNEAEAPLLVAGRKSRATIQPHFVMTLCSISGGFQSLNRSTIDHLKGTDDADPGHATLPASTMLAILRSCLWSTPMHCSTGSMYSPPVF